MSDNKLCKNKVALAHKYAGTDIFKHSLIWKQVRNNLMSTDIATDQRHS